MYDNVAIKYVSIRVSDDYLQTWKTTVTPVDVLELFLSTNMKDLSDTGICTEVILIYKHGRSK